MNIIIEIPYRLYLFAEVFLSIIILCAALILIYIYHDPTNISPYISFAGSVITLTAIVIAYFNFLTNLEEKIQIIKRENLTKTELSKIDWIQSNAKFLYKTNIIIILAFSFLGTLLGGVAGFM